MLQATPLAKRVTSSTAFCGREHQVVRLESPSEFNLYNYSLPPRTLPVDTTGLVVIITAVHPNYWAGQDYKAEPTTGNLQEGRWFPPSANESLSDRRIILLRAQCIYMCCNIIRKMSKCLTCFFLSVSLCQQENLLQCPGTPGSPGSGTLAVLTQRRHQIRRTSCQSQTVWVRILVLCAEAPGLSRLPPRQS